MQILAIIVALIAIGGGYLFFTKAPAAPAAPTTPIVEEAQAQPTAPVTTETPAPVAPVAAPVSMKKKYIDGQYSADATYTVPENAVEKITVSLTIKDGVITAADFTGEPKEQGSVFNQKKFSEGYKALVVGKNIDEVALTVVNGASLTPKAFMDALGQIKVKAQSQA